MKMSRWSNAATSLVVISRSRPLPNTSPDMSPTPTQVNGVVPISTSISRKWRFTDSQAPRAVMPIFLWS